MAPALQLCNFRPKDVSKQLNQCIKNLIFMRKHKQFVIQKPVLNFNTSEVEKQWYDPSKQKNNINFFKTQQEEEQQKRRTNKVLLERKLNDDYVINENVQTNMLQLTTNGKNLGQNNLHQNGKKTDPLEPITYKKIKTKIIKKVMSQTINKEKQRQIQKQYCKYLLNSLHKNNLLLIHHGVPPQLSVLQTIDDGDYLQQGQRKQYPHYSNVLQPIQLPHPQSHLKIIKEPVRYRISQHVFSIQSLTVFKVKHIYLLLQSLFSESIRICSIIRQMNYKGDYSLRIQNENHQFQKLGEMIGVNFKTCKLLFDMLNDHYDVEKELEIGKSDDYKLRVCKELKDLARKEIQEYFEKKIIKNKEMIGWWSEYIPIDEYYLSLKDLRDVFIEVYHHME